MSRQFYTDVTTPQLTVFNLTSGRVPFVSTGGLLADSANLTFSVGTGTVSMGSAAGDKIQLYSNTYGIGIETNTITSWAAGNHRWRIGGTSVSTGTEVMLVNASGVNVTGSVTTTVAANPGVIVRSGASGSYTAVVVGRTSNEVWMGVSSSANQWFTGTVAGDGALVSNTQSLFLGSGGVNPAIKITTTNRVLITGGNAVPTDDGVSSLQVAGAVKAADSTFTLNFSRSTGLKTGSNTGTTGWNNLGTDGVGNILNLFAGSETIFGFAQAYELQFYGNSTTTNRQRAGIVTSAIDNTDASRKYRLTFNIWDTAAREAIRIDTTGAVAQVGIAGAVSGTNTLSVNGDANVSGIQTATTFLNGTAMGITGGSLYVGSSSSLNFTNGTWTGGIDTYVGRLAANSLYIRGHNNFSAVGLTLQLQGRSDTTISRAMGESITSWIDVTDATRKARVVFNVYDTAAREAMRFDTTGSVAQVSIAGAVNGTNTFTVNGSSYFSGAVTSPGGLTGGGLYSTPLLSRMNTDNGSATVWYKFATLPASSGSNGPILKISFVGGEYTSINKVAFTFIIATRDSLNVRMVDATGKMSGGIAPAGVVVYQEADLSYSLYVKLAGTFYSGGQVTVQDGSWITGATFLSLTSGSPTNTTTPTGTLVFDSTSSTAYTGFVTDLASGRVLLGTTTDDGASKLQVAGAIKATGSITSSSGSLVSSNASGTSTVTVSGTAATIKGLVFQTGSAFRWQVFSDSTAESGSNAGSNLGIARYSDGGTFIDSPITVNRATGITTITSLATPSVTDSGLTSGRVTFAGTGGLLTDNASLTFDATNGRLGVGPQTGTIRYLAALGTTVGVSNEAFTIVRATAGTSDMATGLNLENSSNAGNTYSPLLAFSRKSDSGVYSIPFAAIGGQRTGVGADGNWSIGDLVFMTIGTAGGSTLQERFRITSTGVGQFPSSVGDKLYFFSNTYGIGIESSTLTQWSATNHRWRIGGTSVSTGTQYMQLTTSGLAVTGSITASSLTSGRVVLSGASGLLADNSGLTFDTTTGLLVATVVSTYRSGTAQDYHHVAEYVTGGVTTGTIKISLPKLASNCMMRVKIEGYDYSASSGWEVIVSGYNFSDGNWYNYATELRGSPPFTSVRLAQDGTNNLILLGVTTTSWSYGRFIVSTLATNDFSGWGSGWAVTLITSETGITNIATPVVKEYMTPGGNKLIGTTIDDGTTLRLYRATGNVGQKIESVATNAVAELDLIANGTGGGSWGIGTGWTGAGVGKFYIYDNLASAIRLAIAPTTGNLLIGTTTDDGANKLQVNGGIKGTTGSFSGAISGTTGTFSALTSSRVPFVSTAGLLIDSAGLTYNTNNQLALGTSSGAGSILFIDATLATQPQINFRSAGVDKWALYRMGGVNDFAIYDYAALSNAVTIVSNNGTITLARNTAVTGTLTATSDITSSTNVVATGRVNTTAGVFATGAISLNLGLNTSSTYWVLDAVGATFHPAVDATRDLGTPALRVRNGYFSGAIQSSSVTNSGLTSGRVTFAGTGGLLADDANLTFASNNLTLGAGSLTISGAAQGVVWGGSRTYQDVSGNLVSQLDGTSKSWLWFDSVGSATRMSLAQGGGLTLTESTLGSTSTDGLVLVNPTAATSVVTAQMSPRIRLSGSGWKANATAASQTQDWIIENLPATGAATTVSTLKFGNSNNGAAYTYPMTLTDSGVLTVSSNITAVNGSVSSGAIFSGNLFATTNLGFFADATAATQTGLFLRSAGTGKWRVCRAASTDAFEIYDDAAASDAVSIVTNGGAITLGRATNVTPTNTTANGLSLTQTWAASGTTFTGLQVSITNSAAASGSNYFLVQGGAGGTTKFVQINNTGLGFFGVTPVAQQSGSQELSTSLANYGLLNGAGTYSINTSGSVTAASFSGSGASLNSIPESAVTNLVSDLASKAPLASPTFTGTPTSPSITFTTGQGSGVYSSYQVRFGYSGTSNYPHFIHTNHNSGTSVGNTIDFYTSDGTLAGVFPTNAIHGLTISSGTISVGSTGPVNTLDLFNATTAGTSFTANTTSTGATKRSQASIQSSWISSVEGSQKGRLILNAIDAAGTREAIRVDTTGAAAQVSIVGAVNGSYSFTVNGTSYFSGDMGLGAANTNIATMTSRLVHRTIASTAVAGTAGEIAYFSGSHYSYNGTTWTQLGSAGGSYQPLDATLTALAGLTTASDQLIYSTGVDTFAMSSLTSAARTLIALNATSGNVLYASGTNTWAQGTPDTAGLVDKASAQTIAGQKTITNPILRWNTSSPTHLLQYDSTGYLQHTDGGAGNAIGLTYYRKAATSKKVARWSFDWSQMTNDSDFVGVTTLYTNDYGGEHSAIIIQSDGPSGTPMVGIGSAVQYYSGVPQILTVNGPSYFTGQLSIIGANLYVSGNITATGTISGSFGAISASSVSASGSVSASTFSGSGSGITDVRKWIKITKTYADFSAAATTNSITLYTLPAAGIITGVKIRHSTAFNPTTGTYSIDVGISGENNRYTPDGSWVASTTVSGDCYLASCMDTFDHGATKTITVTATTTTSNLSTATAGSVDIWLEVSVAI